LYNLQQFLQVQKSVSSETNKGQSLLFILKLEELLLKQNRSSNFMRAAAGSSFCGWRAKWEEVLVSRHQHKQNNATQSVLGSKPLASVLFFPFLALRVGLLVRKRGEFAGHGAGTAWAALAKKINGDWGGGKISAHSGAAQSGAALGSIGVKIIANANDSLCPSHSCVKI
jgi:hypothetical protein